MPAHVGIDGNEAADELAKEARNLNKDPSNIITLDDANAIPRYSRRVKPIGLGHQVCVINENREITKTIARLRTRHLGGMKINADGTRTYKYCRNCPGEELTLEHIFDCPATLAALQSIGEFPFQGELYNEKIVDLARAVISAYGSI